MPLRFTRWKPTSTALVRARSRRLIIEVVQGPNGHSVFERDYYAACSGYAGNAVCC